MSISIQTALENIRDEFDRQLGNVSATPIRSLEPREILAGKNEMAFATVELPDSPISSMGITRVRVLAYYAVHIAFDADLAAVLAKAVPMIAAVVRAQTKTSSVFPSLTNEDLVVYPKPLEQFLNPLAKNGGVRTISIDFDLEMDVPISIT